MTKILRPAHGFSRHRDPGEVLQIFIYGHSALFYWWPMWVGGYLMSLVTWLHHDSVIIDNRTEWFYPNSNLSVVFTMLLLMLTVLTSTQIKGMKAALIMVGAAFFTLLFVYLDWWQSIMGWFGNQSISLSFGFYFFYSSVLFVIWVVSVFVIDHLSFWRFRPGQITHEYLGGIVESSYDTDNMTFSLNRQNDFFRHWFVGFGSGDLHMQTMGGNGLKMQVDNVLFVGSKMFQIQRLIATKPDLPQTA